ncbi:MAG: hypothetical protein AB8B97_21210 [Granulosicoccus sp.]
MIRLLWYLGTAWIATPKYGYLQIHLNLWLNLLTKKTIIVAFDDGTAAVEISARADKDIVPKAHQVPKSAYFQVESLL